MPPGTTDGAIATIGTTLVERLHDELADDTDLKQSDVVLGSPASGGNPRLTLYLCAVTPNGHHRGDHCTGADPGPTSGVEAPLVVNLEYLLTAHPATSGSGAGESTTTATGEQHDLLERAMAVLHERSILRAADLGVEFADRSVQIAIEPRSTTELSNVWTTFEDTPFRPSVAYVVGPVPIAVPEPNGPERVTERTIGGDR